MLNWNWLYLQFMCVFTVHNFTSVFHSSNYSVMQKIWKKKKTHNTTHINQEDRESRSIHRNTRKIYEEDKELTYMQKEDRIGETERIGE